MEMIERVFVIMRSTGEYSDRDERPIRFCLTEDEAKAAVELASIEAQRDELPPFRSAHTHGLQMPSGEWLPDATLATRPREARWVAYPNAEEITRQNKLWEAEYYAACLALGHVDPGGSVNYATYSYEEVTLWTNALSTPPEPVESKP